MAESNNNFVVKPFAGNATNNGQFGSFDAGTPQTTNDVIFMQGLDAWLSGWLNATSGATKLPRLEEFQGIQRVFSQALININQYGIKPYLVEETYRLHAFVQDENGKLYQSLEDNNVGNPLADSTKWNNNPFNTGDFALLNGDENETFKVADATANNEAVNLGQFTGLFSENGYVKLPNGLIMQWGKTTAIPTDGRVTVIYPIEFPVIVFNASATLITPATIIDHGMSVSVANVTKTSLQCENQSLISPFVPLPAFWSAIGY